jgi:hypothetical protein
MSNYLQIIETCHYIQICMQDTMWCDSWYNNTWNSGTNCGVNQCRAVTCRSIDQSDSVFHMSNTFSDESIIVRRYDNIEYFAYKFSYVGTLQSIEKQWMIHN